eukprot:GEMP01088493.1.p1 GENE.GEMP01088493.1~~GEMP01088493.1.p1  ORF type:complete len:107 (+),score=4.34 GEMP01088493.1:459-779(+)
MQKKILVQIFFVFVPLKQTVNAHFCLSTVHRPALGPTVFHSKLQRRSTGPASPAVPASKKYRINYTNICACVKNISIFPPPTPIRALFLITLSRGCECAPDFYPAF